MIDATATSVFPATPPPDTLRDRSTVPPLRPEAVDAVLADARVDAVRYVDDWSSRADGE